MTQKYVKDPSIDEDAYGVYETLNRDIGQHFSAVTKGQELYYDVRIFELMSIDLSFNHLSGGILEEIASFDALFNLNLSRNCLSEEIPDKIGAMKSLF